jgi:iron(III) transport system ATP-binding protein
MQKKSVSVRVERVTKRFRNTKGRDDIVAVKEADFEVAPGELVTLLGPSGCGKTTTLRMIAGFELPTSGRIFIGNEDVTLLTPDKRDKATVFQSYGLFPHMTVADNVAYGLRVRKTPRPEIARKVEETLSLVGLADLSDRAPGRLSGGQQQRVALARSLIVEPSVLLLDEPLSNLDALLREQMRIEIRRIQKSLGITAVYVTHDRVEAMSLSDRVIVMKDGKIMQIGTPSEIYENPVSRFVAGFVGKVAFFPVEVLGGTPGAWNCRLGDREVRVERAAEGVAAGTKAVIMARPESLRVAAQGAGLIDGTVRMNVYLGHSVECFVETTYGEILVQIDDPASRTVFPEGSPVSVFFEPAGVRLLNA